MMAGELLIWPGLLLFWLWMTLMQCSGATEMTQWRQVLMEPTWFTNSLQQSTLALSKIMCAVACGRRDWCSVWCHDGSDGCRLTNMLVSGAYQPSVQENIITCYTNSSVPEYAFTASVTSSTEYDNTRVKENMVDGVYGRTFKEITAMAYTDKPWLLLDLKQEVKVTEVAIYPLETSFAETETQDMEVRVGNTQLTDNFQSYTLLGSHPGPAQPGLTIFFNASGPITGRFVSVQNMVESILTILHIEIH